MRPKIRMERKKSARVHNLKKNGAHDAWPWNARLPAHRFLMNMHCLRHQKHKKRAAARFAAFFRPWQRSLTHVKACTKHSHRCQEETPCRLRQQLPWRPLRVHVSKHLERGAWHLERM